MVSNMNIAINNCFTVATVLLWYKNIQSSEYKRKIVCNKHMLRFTYKLPTVNYCAVDMVSRDSSPW